jgi:hypothetical protein
MTPPTPHAAAVADLVDRLEDLAVLAAWLHPETRTLEFEQMCMLTRLRALEAAVMIGNLAEELGSREQGWAA